MNDLLVSNLIPDDLKSGLVNLLINNTPVAYIILDEEYRVQFINENFLKLRKLNRDAVMGEICYNISNGGTPCKHCTVYESRQTGQKEFTLRRDTLPDGSVRFIDDYAIPLKRKNKDDPLYTLEIMVDRTKEMLTRERRDREYDEVLSIFSSLIEAKDTYTAAHSENVRKIAYSLAASMDFKDKELFEISIAASLHDLGKVRVPDRIINKPSKLTDTEFGIIKNHPIASFEMIEDLSSFKNVKNIVRQHHERYDGRGYPDGLKGDEISKGARIVAVADTYEAMTSNRSYRKALSHEYALNEIKKMSGSQFDPDVVKAFEGLDFNFNNADTPVKPKSKKADKLSVDRILIPQKDAKNLVDSEKKTFQSKVDINYLLHEIFDNTPCGYVLMDTRRNVLFVSKYFLEFMGLKEDEVIGRKCYEAGCASSSPCKPCNPCAIEESLISGKAEYMRQEQKTRNGWKIFDLFGVPLLNSDGKADYVIEIIIDRTDEVNLERLRTNDFEKLICTLRNLPTLQNLETEEPELAKKIESLQDRLKELLKWTTC